MADHTDDPTFVVSRRDATDLTIEGSPRALIRDGRPDDAHPGFQADDDTSGLPPINARPSDLSAAFFSERAAWAEYNEWLAEVDDARG